MAESEIGVAPAWVRLSRRCIRVLPRGRYVMMNWLCRRPVAPFYSPLDVTGDGVRFVCDLSDGIAREACFMGFYEPQETTLVRHILRPGQTFVDVGANWGYFTVLAAGLVGRAGRVVSFEPHPSLYPLLEQNIARNGFTWATPLRVAVADTEGELNLVGYAEGSENRGLSRLSERADPRSPNFSVAAGLLEKILDAQGVGEVDLLKMDIEGGEASVLPTLDKGLARARFKRILLELHPAALREQGVNPNSLIEQLFDFGYRAWRLDHSQAAFRRASYKLPKSPTEFLAPFDPNMPLDAWPHILFVAPGEETSW